MATRQSGVVLALGGGGARGLAHVGVLDVLDREGISVRAIAGTSIGAEVGAFYASGMSIKEMVLVVGATGRRKTFELFLPDFASGGLASGKHIVEFLAQCFGDRRIEELAIPFVAVATDLETGEQVVIDRGPLGIAVRASISIPGVLAPVSMGNRLLVDGGLVNPLPADVARERFGFPVIAVAVHGSVGLRRSPRAGHPRSAPAIVDRSNKIIQQELVRLRLAQAPPDILIEPNCRRIGTLEFHRGVEALAAGRRAARQSLPAIARALARAARARTPATRGR